MINTILDNLGRVTSIQGPNEVASNKPYTLKFEYHPRKIIVKSDGNVDSVSYAITKHYDATQTDNDKDIETVAFADGFGQAVQVKKEGIIGTTPGMIISGRVKIDAFNRVKDSYYPIWEANGSKTTFNSKLDSIALTHTTYDILDRPWITTLPDGTSTKMEYAIDTINGVNFMKTTVTDALNHSIITYLNGSGKTVRTVQRPDSIPIKTNFGYDAINQLVTVTDAMNETTSSFYDIAGRRTQVNHPASGITKFIYDTAGNLIGKQTANLLKTSDTITYKYDYNRLKAINYPKHSENNVTYIYGNSTDATGFNRKGRIIYQEDGSGGQEFKYGRMGEVTEVRRSLIIPNQAVATYVTNWTYDSWNRVQNMTYPDGEVLNYTYNTAGLLKGLTGTKGSTYTYVKNIGYDKFEQRTSLQYGNGTNGNGALTTYTYNPLTRQLNNLQVLSNNKYIMKNAYTFDNVSNVTDIVNTAETASSGLGGTMKHHYNYDNLYRLTGANGDYNINQPKNAHYDLAMTYDNLHNIKTKKQNITQNGVQFAGNLNASYNLAYNYAANSQQISNIADSSYRYAAGESPESIKKLQLHTYDANGNLVYIQSSSPSGIKSNERKLLWDEENRLLALSDNGFVSNYWYDAIGERTVKTSGDGQGVFVNGVLSGAITGTTDFTAYINPYFVVNNGGNYSKHIYIGSQRIMSKLASSDIFTESPLTIAKATSKDFTDKYDNVVSKIKTRYDSLGVTYRGTDNVGAGMITLTGKIKTPLQYYFHSDHLGSSSLITDATGALVQHLEYIPFGEVFIDERPSSGSWSTPYKFNAKELDEETGLYYYGARYMDPRTSVWISVDPLAEKYPNISGYVYCADNPVKFVDPDGRIIKGFSIDKNGEIHHTKNASSNSVIIANGMMRTEEGKTLLIGLIKAEYPVHLNLQEKKSVEYPDRLGHTETNFVTLKDASNKTIGKKITEVTITLYKEKIQEEVDKYAAVAKGTSEFIEPDEITKLYTKLVPSFEDMITTVATHEGKHGAKKSANSVFVPEIKAEENARSSEIKSINQLTNKKNGNK